MPNNGVGLTSAQLLNSAAYVRVKKLGIGNALGAGVFPGGEQEMLNRIEITGFEIIGATVITKYRINRIPTATTTGVSSSSAITATIAAETFNTNLLTHTVAAITNEPADSWTATGSVFTTVPTDSQGSSGSSLFASHNADTAVTASEPVQNFPGFTSIPSEYTTQENLPNGGAGLTNAQLLSSAVYVKVKKLGIGKTLGDTVFPGGERDMLDRIEITGFEIDSSTTPPSVKTKFKINRISPLNTGAISADAIRKRIYDADGTGAFLTGVLSNTISAISS